MNPSDLLDVAQELVMTSAKRAYLRRATSTTYYALFHTLTNNCADTLIGRTAHINDRAAWRRTYRALDHGFARSQCLKAKTAAFPKAIIDFSEAFVTMQAKRHDADYDPYAKFYKSECQSDIREARALIDTFRAEPITTRRSFASFVLLRSR